jgi:hypothetical protein
MTRRTASVANSPENLRTLCQVAFVANRLAKQLSGRNRALAYEIKSSIVSLLIVAGVASANGIRPDATVGLDIDVGDRPRTRLHVPLSELQPAARAIIEEQIEDVPTVSPLASRLSSDQLSRLAALFEAHA